MKGSERCVHGSLPVKKVCYSKDCQQSAFANMACQQCEVDHDHKGHVTFQNRINLLAEVENVVARKPNKQKLEKLCSIANGVAEELNEICQEVVADFQKVGSAVELKPNIKQFIQLFKSSDFELKGKDAYVLSEALKNEDLFVKDKSSSDKSRQLQQLYMEFLEELEESLNSFKQEKAAFTEEKQPARQANNSSRIAVDTKATNRPTKVLGSNAITYVRPSEPTPKPKQTRAVRIPGTTKYFDNVADIKPGQQGLNLLVKVLWTKQDVSNGKNVVRCSLGDETGCVNGCFYSDIEKNVRKGAVLEFDKVRAYFHQGSIVIQLYHSNSISVSKLEVGEVNTEFNVSAVKF